MFLERLKCWVSQQDIDKCLCFQDCYDGAFDKATQSLKLNRICTVENMQHFFLKWFMSVAKSLTACCQTYCLITWGDLNKLYKTFLRLIGFVWWYTALFASKLHETVFLMGCIIQRVAKLTWTHVIVPWDYLKWCNFSLLIIDFNRVL